MGNFLRTVDNISASEQRLVNNKEKKLSNGEPVQYLDEWPFINNWSAEGLVRVNVVMVENEINSLSANPCMRLRFNSH